MRIIKILICFGIPLGIGGLSAFLCRNDFASYGNVIKPPLAPPALLFPIVWTVLYLLMGYSSYLIVVSQASEKRKKKALILYGVQLALNFIWTPTFFILKNYFASFIVLIFMYFFIWQMTEHFRMISYKAGTVQIPYAIWSTFALYLNLMIMVLN